MGLIAWGMEKGDRRMEKEKGNNRWYK